MNHWRILLVAATLTLALVPQGAAQVPARGFSVLLCVAERAGSVPGGSQVNIQIVSNEGPNSSGLYQATVVVNHGQSFSVHGVVYDDTNESGALDCGDTVLNVT